MAPVRSANRRAQHDHTQQQPIPHPDPHHDPSQDIFIDPMMGTALQIYVEKDVEDRDTIVELIAVRRLFLPKWLILGVGAYVREAKFLVQRHGWKLACLRRVAISFLGSSRVLTHFLLQTHGGIVSPGYSGVPYILGMCLSSSRARGC